MGELDYHRKPPQESLQAYRWMAEQLRNRVPSELPYPMWSYLSPTSSDGCYRLETIQEIGSEIDYVLVEHVKRQSEIIVSDIGRWSLVLLGDYVSATEEDFNRFQREFDAASSPGSTRSVSQGEIERSWMHIFDVADSTYDYSEWGGDPSDIELQACYWKIEYNEVISISPLPRNSTAMAIHIGHIYSDPGWWNPRLASVEFD